MAFDFNLAATPPMGFNTWNRFGMQITEQLIDETMTALLDTGLHARGYRYVNIDDGWMAPERGPDGRLRPDPNRFAGGIARLADLAHRRGFKLGIYSDAGTKTCGGLPASYGHEAVDAETFAAWGIDYLKYDWCHVPFEDFPGQSHAAVAETLYTKMSRALIATGRPIVFSICNWGDGNPWEWARGIGHLWRTTGDIADVYREGGPEWAHGMVPIFRRNIALSDYTGPGGWNDPDMLEVGNGGMSTVEYQSHFALWCMMAAPLLIGTDVRHMSPETLGLLGNERLIAIDQDRLGIAARIVREADGVVILSRPLAGGAAAVAVFNEGDAPATVNVEWEAIRYVPDGPLVVEDVWTGDQGTPLDYGSVRLAPHATAAWVARRAG
jgi:alpha-galactosidase